MSGKEQYNTSRTRSWSTADFYFGMILGEGLYGKVYFAKFKEQQQRPQQSDEDIHGALNENVQVPEPPETGRSAQFSPVSGSDSGSDGCIAIKVVDKVQIMKQNKQNSIIRERRILSKMTSINSPWIIPLYMSFVDKHNLYMVMELGVGGTLHSLVVSEQKFDLDVVSIQYYCGQIICALEHLHSHAIYHCDLKPQNVVITFDGSGIGNENGKRGRIKIIDFDCAVDLNESTRTFCRNENDSIRIDIDFAGTADYVAPEVLKGSVLQFQSHDTGTNTARKTSSSSNNNNNNNNYTHRHCFAALDLWSYGCLVYFMFASQSPFHTESDYKTMQRILSFVNNASNKNHKGPPPDDCSSDINEDGDEYISWTDKIPPTAKDLITKLVVLNPFLRSGMDDIPLERKDANEIIYYKYDSIRMHKFFQNLDWDSTEKACPTDNQCIVLPQKMKMEELMKNIIDGADSNDIMEHLL